MIWQTFLWGSYQHDRNIIAILMIRIALSHAIFLISIKGVTLNSKTLCLCGRDNQTRTKMKLCEWIYCIHVIKTWRLSQHGASSPNTLDKGSPLILYAGIYIHSICGYCLRSTLILLALFSLRLSTRAIKTFARLHCRHSPIFKIKIQSLCSPLAFCNYSEWLHSLTFVSSHFIFDCAFDFCLFARGS